MPSQRKPKRVSVPRVGYDFPDLDISPINPISQDHVIADLDESSFINQVAEGRVHPVPLTTQTSSRLHRRSSQSDRSAQNQEALNVSQYLSNPADLNITNVFADAENTSPSLHNSPNDSMVTQRRSRFSKKSSLSEINAATLNHSSDRAFNDLLSDVDSILAASYPDTINFLAKPDKPIRSLLLLGCNIFVDIVCCGDYAATIRRFGRELGAQIVHDASLSSRITHYVFGCGGSRKTAKTALFNNALLVKPDWLEQCYSKMQHLPEEYFCLNDAELNQPCPRKSSKHVNVERDIPVSNVDEESNINELDPSHLVRVSHSGAGPNVSGVTRSSTASELQRIFDDDRDHHDQHNATNLLARLDELDFHNRIDKVLQCDSRCHGLRCYSRLLPSGITAEEYMAGRDAHHVPAPTSRRQPTGSRPRRRSRNATLAAQVGNLFARRKVLRRRSFDCFALRHREPDGAVAEMQEANLEERLAVTGLRLSMTEETARAVTSRKRNGKKKARTALAKTQATTQLVQLSDAMTTLSLNGPTEHPRQNLESQRQLSQRLSSPRVPYVETASSFVDRILASSSSSDFTKWPTTRVNRVVLTNFSKNREARLCGLLYAFGIRCTKIVDNRTRCIVSCQEDRTLHILKAVVREIPIVKSSWIEESAINGKILPLRDFEWRCWTDLIQARKRTMRNGQCSLFEDLGHIFVHKSCNRPSWTDLSMLIRLSGGKLTKDMAAADICVYPKNTPRSRFSHIQRNICIVPECYFIDCICENSVLPLAQYSNQPDSFVVFLTSDEDITNGHLTD